MLLLALATLCTLLCPPARAAPAASPPASHAPSLFETFDAHARAAESALRSRPDPDAAGSEASRLHDLRQLLAADREKAIALAARGSLELRVLNAQIDALGPLPEEGASEPKSVAEQRARLGDQLSAQMRPALALDAAEARAAVLVSELDARQKALTKQRLFTHDVSALDPRQWLRAARELGEVIANTAGRFQAFTAQKKDIALLRTMALALLVALATPALGFLGWTRLARRIEARREGSDTIAGKLGWTLLLDGAATLLFAIVLLVVLIATLVFLLPLMPRDLLKGILPALVGAGGLIAVGRWLGRGAVLSPFAQLRLITLPPAQAPRANRIMQRLTTLLAAILVLDALEANDALAPNLSHILSAILACWGAWLLWQLVSAFRAAQEAAPAQDPGAHEAIDFLTPISRLMRLFALTSFVAALIGYAMLARFLFSSTLITLALVGIAVYLHRSIALVTGLLGEGRLAPYRRALHFIPLATGFVLTVLVLPVIAVVWGFSGAEIADGVRLLRNGVELGEVRISIGDLVTFATVFVLGLFLTRWLQRFLRITVLPEFAMDAGAQAALLTFLGYLGITLAALVAIATTGLDLSNLAFVAGALSVGLGFGLQSVVENFTSGILLLLERPVKVGDWIEVGGHSGIVRKISVRSTHIETFDRHQIIVPNSQLISGVVHNRTFTGGPSRIEVAVGVAYGTDLETARALLLAIAREDEGVLAFPEPSVILERFGDSAIDLRMYAFVHAASEGLSTSSRLNFALARRFQEEGIAIPFPQRDLHVRTVPEGWPPAQPATAS
nr:mechanosensitive ion channel domain-containing protein [Novosphingobium profundi]